MMIANGGWLVPRVRSLRSHAIAMGVVMAFITPTGHAQSLVMEMIAPKSRMVNDLTEVLRGQFPNSKIHAFNGLIIVQADASEMTKIKQMVALLDKPPKQLIIRLRNRADNRQNIQDFHVAGQYCHNGVCVGGQNGRVQMTGQRSSLSPAIKNRNSGWIGVRGAVGTNSQTQTTGQFIRTLEGGTAYLAFGQSIPITQVSYGPFYQQMQTQMIDVLSGIYVRPYLTGDQQFRLEIDVSGDRMDNGQFIRKTIKTEIEGALNTWIPLSAVDQSTHVQQSALTGRDNRQNNQLDHYEIMVELSR